MRITELESKLVQTNVNYLKAKDLSDRLAQRMEEQKRRFNDLVKDKVKLQEELIKSEAEKLKVSKKLIEIQINNSQLSQQISENTYDVNMKLMNAEDDLLEMNMKEERAAKAISSLEDKLIEARNDRKDFEIELIALKKNYFGCKNDLDAERIKVENLNIEMINLVNENNALHKDMKTELDLKGNVDQSRRYLEMRLERIEKELSESQQALLEAQGEKDRLKVQI